MKSKTQAQIVSEIDEQIMSLESNGIKPECLILGNMAYMYLREMLSREARAKGLFAERRNKVDTEEIYTVGDTGEIAIRKFKGLRVIDNSKYTITSGTLKDDDFEVTVLGKSRINQK